MTNLNSLLGWRAAVTDISGLIRTGQVFAAAMEPRDVGGRLSLHLYVALDVDGQIVRRPYDEVTRDWYAETMRSP